MDKEFQYGLTYDPSRDKTWRRLSVFFVILLISAITYYFYANPTDNDLMVFIAFTSVTLMVYHFFAKVDVGYCDECMGYIMNYERADEEE
jgi:hypothetical protein